MYLLFLSKVCPFSHQCEIASKYSKDLIKIIYCDPILNEKDIKWKINENEIKDFCIDLNHYSLPLLLDTHKIIITKPGGVGAIAENESFEIIKFLSDLTFKNIEFYKKFNDNFVICIDKVNRAPTIEYYTLYYNTIFTYLEWFNEYMKDKLYIQDQRLSILDIIIYTHLIRFDLIYYNLYSLNKKHLWEYKHILTYMKLLSNTPNFKNATHIEKIKQESYGIEYNHRGYHSHTKIPLGNGGVDHYFVT